MLSASLLLNPACTVAPVSRRTFGSFVEHMGRCVHTVIYEPTHPTADADGFRTAVLALTRELGVSLMRYPGGNFVSGYRWDDGIGPAADRPPVRRGLAWPGLAWPGLAWRPTRSASRSSCAGQPRPGQGHVRTEPRHPRRAGGPRRPRVSIAIGCFAALLRLAEACTLGDDDRPAVDTAERPDRLLPRPTPNAAVTADLLEVTLPPVSWTAIRLTH